MFFTSSLVTLENPVCDERQRPPAPYRESAEDEVGQGRVTAKPVGPGGYECPTAFQTTTRIFCWEFSFPAPVTAPNEP